MQRLNITTESMIALYETGLSASEVAKQLNCSSGTIKQRFRNISYIMRSPNNRTDRWYSNIAKAREGKCLSAMEKRFKSYFKRYGIDMIPNYAIGRYNIDLADTTRKIGVEIDSPLHRNPYITKPEHLKRSKLKDAYAKKQGWLIIHLETSGNPRGDGSLTIPKLLAEHWFPDSRLKYTLKIIRHY